MKVYVSKSKLASQSDIDEAKLQIIDEGNTIVEWDPSQQYNPNLPAICGGIIVCPPAENTVIVDDKGIHMVAVGKGNYTEIMTFLRGQRDGVDEPEKEFANVRVVINKKIMNVLKVNVLADNDWKSKFAKIYAI